MKEDIYKIAKYLVQLYGLKISNIRSPKDYLYRWMDFRLRYIDPKPRRVLLAKHLKPFFQEILKKPWTGLADKTLYELFVAIERGDDINKWQSSTLYKNDTNHWSEKSKNQKKNRTDLLWADWGIWHFNLRDINTPLVKKSDLSLWQIFFTVLDDSVLVIDICQHRNGDEWADQQMLEILHDNWPAYTERFELKGIIPPRKEDYPTQQDLYELRTAGVNSPPCVGGKLFIGFGGGITTANTSTRVTQKMGTVLDCYFQIVDSLSINSEGKLEFIESANKNNRVSLKAAISRDGLGFYYPEGNHFWFLTNRDQSDLVGKLNNLFLPKWVMQKLKTDINFRAGSICFGENLEKFDHIEELDGNTP